MECYELNWKVSVNIEYNRRKKIILGYYREILNFRKNKKKR